jgi:protein-tyrosine phosphatase
LEKIISDLHIHIVPNVDDGASNLSMAFEMLSMAYEQGVRTMYCTSHNVYDEEEIKRYQSQFLTLQICSKAKYPDLTLYPGCELLCAGEYIEDIIYGLEIGVFLPLGNSKFVLTELYPDVVPQEAAKIVDTLRKAGWNPILAHVERYPNLFDGDIIQQLKNIGASVQVNLYSLNEEKNIEVKRRARWLVDNKFADFVGSDAHRSNHRPPNYISGIDYIYRNCEKDYADLLCHKNAEILL